MKSFMNYRYICVMYCFLYIVKPLEVLGVLQQEAGGGGSGFEHAHEVQVQTGWVEFLKVGSGALLAVLALLCPGGDPVLGLDVPQRVVVRTDELRTVEHLPDDGALLGQRHKAVPEGHHPDNGRVDVLDIQQVS